MPAECAFVLPNGRKCRCMATRNHAYCRHHGAPRAAGKPRRDPGLWSRLACWRSFSHDAAATPKEETVLQAINVLEALRENNISDRTAGRLLRTFLQRWDALPLMPTPETGLAWGEPELSPAPPNPAAPARARGSAPLAPGAMPSPEKLAQFAEQLCAKIGAGRR